MTDHARSSADIRDEAVDRALARFTEAANSMVACKRCNGTGYHHGFGEHGHDPDWCEVCGGCQSVPEFDDREAMRQAIKAAQSGAPAQCAGMREALEWYAKDYDYALGCSQWDGGARARAALATAQPPAAPVETGDLVKRLRTKHIYGSFEIEQQRQEAADVIERLCRSSAATGEVK